MTLRKPSKSLVSIRSVLSAIAVAIEVALARIQRRIRPMRKPKAFESRADSRWVKGSTMRVSPGAPHCTTATAAPSGLRFSTALLHLRVGEGQRQAVDLQGEFPAVDAGRTVQRQDEFHRDGSLLRHGGCRQKCQGHEPRRHGA
jgi:hypothetical protein